MANPHKRRFGEDRGKSGSLPESLPVFRPNYGYDIRRPILIPASDEDMIALVECPYNWPTLPILVLARTWRGGLSDLDLDREMAFLFGGDWKDIHSPPTDTFLLYRMTMEDIMNNDNFPPQECHPENTEEDPCTPAFLAWLRGRRVYEYPTGATMLADGWKILRLIECEDCLIRLF